MTDRIELDLTPNDKDETPDVIVESTNGHTVYIDVMFLVKIIGGTAAAVLAAVGIYVSV